MIGSGKQIVVIGASGGLGNAMLCQLVARGQSHVYAFSRSQMVCDAPNITLGYLDLMDEASIEAAAASLPDGITLSQVIVATGMLHDDGVMPEKSIRDLSSEKFQKLFAINSIGPALVAKHFVPRLVKDESSIFAAISARVGSISDNYLGGWYAYRASKAALNMIIRNLSIEVARQNKQAIMVGLHPGTVDTALSEPFQNHVPDGKLFSAEQSAVYLLEMMSKLTPKDSGKCFAWDGEEIEA